MQWKEKSFYKYCENTFATSEIMTVLLTKSIKWRKAD